MPVWPAGLPQFVEVQGYSEKPAPNVIRSGVDEGPAKQRRRGTAGAEPISVVVMLTAVERTTFKNFHQNDIGHGALSFDWLHPVERTPAKIRMVEGQYDLTPVSGSFFRLGMNLEVLP